MPIGNLKNSKKAYFVRFLVRKKVTIVKRILESCENCVCGTSFLEKYSIGTNLSNFFEKANPVKQDIDISTFKQNQTTKNDQGSNRNLLFH